MTGWAPLLWLALAALALMPVTRWFGQRVQGLVFLLTDHPLIPLHAHFLLLLPGVLLHEISHWAVANLLGLKTGRLLLRPRIKSPGVVQMGALQYERADPIRESIVGLAPLVSGTIVVLLVASHRLGLDPQGTWRLEDLPSRVVSMTQATDAWIWIYLMLAISNAMVPSASDTKPWRVVAIYLALALVVFALLGGPSLVPTTALALGVLLCRYLALTFSLTVCADLFVGTVLWGVEIVLGMVLGRRVEYG